MGLYQGSFFEIGDAIAAAVAPVDSLGNPLPGFDGSRPANATLTSVVSSATSVVLVAANAARRQVIIVNASSKNLFIAFGGTASLTVYTYQIGPNSSYETPLNGYTGNISGIWSAVNGSAKITEITT